MSSIGMPLDATVIMSVAMEAILYGLSIFMFAATMWSLTYKNKSSGVNRPMTLVAIVLLIVSTAHMVIDIIRALQGLVTYRDAFPGGPVAFFADFTQSPVTMKGVLYALQTLVGDAVVIYRCHVIWRSVWVIILPSLLWIGIGVSAVGSIYSNMHASAINAVKWGTSFFLLTLVTNMMSSGLLAYRIWRIKRTFSSISTTRGHRLPILRVLVDAAVLYSVTILCTLVCFLYKNNVQYVLFDMLMPIISISFYMIIIRLSINTRTHHSLFDICNCVATGGGSMPKCQIPLVHVSEFTRMHAVADIQSYDKDPNDNQHHDHDEDKKCQDRLSLTFCDENKNILGIRRTSL